MSGVRGRRYAAVGQMSGQKIGSEVTGQPPGRKSEVKTRGTEVSGQKSDVRGVRQERPGIRGQRGQGSAIRRQKSKKFKVRDRFNDKSIRRVSTCASKRLPDSITYQKVKRKSHQ